MATLKFTIDSQDFTDSIRGAEELTERFFQSEELKGFLIEVNGQIECVGDAYDYLREQFKTNFRNLLQVEIVRISDIGQPTKVFDGIIKVSEIEFNLIEQVATCELLDNSYMALIDNNKQIKAFLNAGQSKSGASIAPATLTTGFDMFNYATGNYTSAYSPAAGWGSPDPFIYGTVSGFYVRDALDFLVRFMTNGQVDGVVSDYLNPSATIPTVAAECALFLGSTLRTRQDSKAPEISFYELFRDLHKLFNIWFIIEPQSNGRLKMRIENYEYFRRKVSENAIEVNDLTETVLQESLFSSIRIGSAIDNDGYSPRQFFRYQFKEEYGTAGQEGNDTVLDLELERLITCTNTIKRALMVTLRGGQEDNPYVRGRNTGTLISGGIPYLVDSSDQTFADVQTQVNQLITLPGVSGSAVTGQNGSALTNPDEQSIDINLFTSSPVPYQIFENDTAFDNEVFLIYCPDKQAEKTQSPDGFYYYNDSISNLNTIQNHLTGIPSSIAKYLPGGTDNFRAGFATYVPDNAQNVNEGNATWFSNTALNFALTNGKSPAQEDYIVKFQDDSTSPNFDTSGNYDPATGRFTSPADGYYSFYFKAWLREAFAAPPPTSIRPPIYAVLVAHLNSAGASVIDAKGSFTRQIFSSWQYIEVQGGFFLPAGDIAVAAIVDYYDRGFVMANARAQFNFQFQEVQYPESYFAALGEDYSGIIGTQDDRDSDLLELSGQGAIETAAWQTIKQNPYYNLQFKFGQNLNLTSRPIEIERNILSGETAFRSIRNFDFATDPFNENAPK